MKLRFLTPAIFAVLFSCSVAAVELSQPDDNFPNGWKEVSTETCTPKAGTLLENKVHVLPAHNNMLMMVVRLSKNGAYVMQTLVLFIDGKPVGLRAEIIDGDKLLSFSSDVQDDLERMQGAMYKALGITAEEFASCKNKK